MTAPLKLHPSLTSEVVCAAVERRLATLDNPGFCIACRAGEIVTTEDFSCPNFIPSEKRP